MSDKDVKIAITTTANTQGAKQAEGALQQVEKQAKAAEAAAADAMDYGNAGLGAELEQKFREAKDQAEKLKDEVKDTKTESAAAGDALAGAATKAAAFAGIVQILNQAATLIRGIGDEQRELNGEADDWVNIIGQVEDAVTSLLNPVKLGYDLFSGYDALYQQLANQAIASTNKALEAYVEAVQKRREADEKAAADRTLEKKFEREKTAIDAQIRLLERRNDLTDAARSSADRVKDANDKIQINRIERGPGTESQKEQEIANIKLASVNRDLTNRIAELNGGLDLMAQKTAKLEEENAKLNIASNNASVSQQALTEKLRQFESAATLAFQKFKEADNFAASAQKTREGGGAFASTQAADLDRQAADSRRAGSRAAGDPNIRSAADIEAKIEALKQQVEEQGKEFSKVDGAFKKSSEDLTLAKENLADSAQKIALEIEALQAEAKAERDNILSQVKDTQQAEIQKQADDLSDKITELGAEGKQARDKITDAAKEALKGAEEAAAEAQESGQQASGNLRTAITKLNQVLADGTVTPDEMGKLDSGLLALKKSHEMVGQKVVESTIAQVDINAKLLAKLDAQSRQLAAHQAQINQLLAR